MAQPQIPQGTLNRVLGSVVWASFPALNVTAPFLGERAIEVRWDTPATTTIPTLTGVVQSPEPFQQVTLMINLLRTQGLANTYEARRVVNTLLGDCTVRSDSSVLQVYQLTNMAIVEVAPLAFAGKDAGYEVTLKGAYPINSSLYL